MNYEICLKMKTKINQELQMKCPDFFAVQSQFATEPINMYPRRWVHLFIWLITIA